MYPHPFTRTITIPQANLWDQKVSLCAPLSSLNHSNFTSHGLGNRSQNKLSFIWPKTLVRLGCLQVGPKLSMTSQGGQNWPETHPALSCLIIWISRVQTNATSKARKEEFAIERNLQIVASLWQQHNTPQREREREKKKKKGRGNHCFSGLLMADDLIMSHAVLANAASVLHSKTGNSVALRFTDANINFYSRESVGAK